MSESRSTGVPFSHVDGDIIIRSSDLVDFRVHRVLLTELFYSFDDMLGAPMVGTQTTHDQLPVVPVTERSEVINHLLRLLYPIPFPDLSEDWTALLALCAALDKYVAKFYPLSVAHALRLAAKSPNGPGLGPVYILACRHPSLIDLRMEVAKLALGKASRLDDVPKDLLSGMSATQYHAFVDYQNRCHKVAEEATLPDNIVMWVPIAEIPGASGTSCTCHTARSLDGFQWDEVGNGVDGQPVYVKSYCDGYFVPWLSDYLDNVRSALKTEISGSVISYSNNVIAGLSKAMNCASCSKLGVSQMLSFVEKLAAHVDEQIDAVPFHVA